MTKPILTVVIPGLNEEFFQDTVTNILENSCSNTEIVAVLDGFWPPKGLVSHDRLRVIHNENPIGQRQATNQGVRLSEAKFIMKIDAHVAVSKGFDEELMRTCKYDWTMIPRMYTLDAFHWLCNDCKKEYQQGPVMVTCEVCGSKQITKKIIFDKKDNKRTDYMWINDELRMKYFDRPGLSPYGDTREIKRRCSHKNAEWSRGDITDVMTCIGAGFFMHRDRYWELGGMDEEHGSWGQMAVELSMKAWLSGGRMVVNKRCWFAHLARTQKGFGFPYSHKKGAIEKARSRSRDLWMGNKWPQAIHTYDWLIKKFSPLPGWTKEQSGNFKIEPPMIHEPYKDIPTIDNKPRVIHLPEVTKGIIYYTDNLLEEKIATVVRNQIGKCRKGIHLVSASLLPISFGENIVLEEKRSRLTMFKQILTALEESRADVVFLTEHDVIYHPVHFEFNPPKDDTYYYNRSIWIVDSKSGHCIYYLGGKTSQLCANRDLLVEHYKKKVEVVEANGWNARIGYEPGNRRVKRGGIDDFGREYFFTEYPNIDIRHKSNLTPKRNKKKHFRREPQEWQESDSIPFWGKMTDGGFDNLLDRILKDEIKYD